MAFVADFFTRWAGRAARPAAQSIPRGGGRRGLWPHPSAAPPPSRLASTSGLVYRSCAAAKCRADERALLATDNPAEAGAPCGRTADDQRGLGLRPRGLRRFPGGHRSFGVGSGLAINRARGSRRAHDANRSGVGRPRLQRPHIGVLAIERLDERGTLNEAGVVLRTGADAVHRQARDQSARYCRSHWFHVVSSVTGLPAGKDSNRHATEAEAYK